MCACVLCIMCVSVYVPVQHGLDLSVYMHVRMYLYTHNAQTGTLNLELVVQTSLASHRDIS